jgi:DUF1009 family protein
VHTPEALAIIAGNGAYPGFVAAAARAAGVKRIVAAAFTGETDPGLTSQVDTIEWLRVGQLARLLDFFRRSGVRHAMMAGQIAPKNLFDLRPDWKALLLLARLKKKNAETIFGAIADELARVVVRVRMREGVAEVEPDFPVVGMPRERLRIGRSPRAHLTKPQLQLHG